MFQPLESWSSCTIQFFHIKLWVYDVVVLVKKNCFELIHILQWFLNVLL